MLRITTGVLDEARIFFESRGAVGCEGTALIAGRLDEPASRLVVPDQVAHPVPWASVTVTPAGELQLAAALDTDERFVARIHSHPGLAFHSETDDENPVLTHQGAVSIVVPFFGLGLRTGFDACAVLVRRGESWIDLPPGPDRDAVILLAGSAS